MTDEYAAGVIQGRGTVRNHWPGREEFVPLLRVEVRDEEVVVAQRSISSAARSPTTPPTRRRT
jgi:hypothetical protein